VNVLAFNMGQCYFEALYLYNRDPKVFEAPQLCKTDACSSLTTHRKPPSGSPSAIIPLCGVAVISAKVSRESVRHPPPLANEEWLMADLARRGFRQSISTELGTVPFHGDDAAAAEWGTLVDDAPAADLFTPPSLELLPNDNVDDL